MDDVKRYLVVRVPGSGPKAVIAPPCDFPNYVEAAARIAEIEAAQAMIHHTHLEIEVFSGDRFVWCDRNGILY